MYNYIRICTIMWSWYVFCPLWFLWQLFFKFPEGSKKYTVNLFIPTVYLKQKFQVWRIIRKEVKLTLDFYCWLGFGWRMLAGLSSLVYWQSWLYLYGRKIVFIPLTRRQRFLPNFCTVLLVYVHVEMKRGRRLLCKFLLLNYLSCQFLCPLF